MLKHIIDFYLEGFKNMPGHSIRLWIIILIKLFIIFFILKIFFFPNILNSKYDTDKERSDHVIEQLISN